MNGDTGWNPASVLNSKHYPYLLMSQRVIYHFEEMEGKEFERPS